MGALTSRLDGLGCAGRGSGAGGARGKRRKRAREDSCSDDEPEKEPATPKRLKLDSTANYIYERLFIQGEGSDVTISCLNRDWHLHKLYLCQSPYFECMFAPGKWREADQERVEIDLPDTVITEKSLRIAFGSLYYGEVEIPVEEVVAVLAVATLFQLHGMIALCVKIMRHNIKLQTVAHYYDAATLYGQQKLARQCCKWLQRVLMFTQSLDLLKSISVQLMTEIVSSHTFFVNQVEMDVYTLLKKWTFISLNPGWSGQRRDLLTAKDEFFAQLSPPPGDSQTSFLETDVGARFAPAFRALRLQYITADRASLIRVKQDNVLPWCWLRDVCWMQWQAMLEVEQRPTGASPASSSGGSEDGGDGVGNSLFNKTAMRCGRILDIPNTHYCWRWTGFNFGIDLLLLFQNNQLMIKRNVSTHPSTHSLSMQEKRALQLRVDVLNFDTNYNTSYFKTSGVITRQLAKDEEVVVMTIDRYATFPMYLSFNMLTMIPDSSLYPTPHIDSLLSDTSFSSVQSRPAALVVGAAGDTATAAATVGRSRLNPSNGANNPSSDEEELEDDQE